MSLQTLEQSLIDGISAAADETELESLRVSALGKKGAISERMKTLADMSPEERKTQGAELNALKEKLTQAIVAKKAAFQAKALEARVATEKVDVTLPVRPEAQGSIHPVSQVWEEIVQIWGDLGFSVAEGPHIENDFYNFGALNMPAEHPARQEHDTFYFHPKADGSRMLLRTHTSPVQIRTMQSQKPPIYIIAPGRTYRSDSDATHTPMFHQVEGLVIDRDITLGHLKWTLQTFLTAFFERDDIVLRLRPSYFPFTEPSAEVDVSCQLCGGSGCSACKRTGWMEIMGAGMVDPAVFESVGYDPERYTGFAFGMGPARIAMQRYGIPDIRLLYENDVRFLEQFV